MKRIRQNARAFKTLTNAKLCAVVKADAYGHGAAEIACALSGVADCFAVSLVDEGLALRAAACGKDILVLTPPLCDEEIYAAAKNGFILTVSDLRTARLIVTVCQRYAVSVRVHLKVNTGMNRYGMTAPALGKTCKYLQGAPCVKVEGIYSHLYECNRQTAALQRQRFLRCQRVCERYFKGLIAHLSATYGALLGKDFAFDMIRVGLGLYGYLPDGAEDLPQATVSSLRLQKGMTVYASVAVNRKYSFGGAGYGKPRRTGERLSVVRLGYADGFARTRENGVCDYENNANNLCMDACIRAKNERAGKELAVLTDAAETAKALGTISYEVLCNATRRAERIYDERD
ncbi:MAG: alanine racemase [Clostridia bacterium]|nr:alanine racemase [Clostridia bacterium]